MIDGLYGDMNYRSGRWIGFYGTDMNVTLDLLEPKEVSLVFVNTMLNTGDAIFGATCLKVEVSEDGKNFRRVASENFPVVEKGTKMQPAAGAFHQQQDGGHFAGGDFAVRIAVGILHTLLP